VIRGAIPAIDGEEKSVAAGRRARGERKANSRTEGGGVRDVAERLKRRDRVERELLPPLRGGGSEYLIEAWGATN